MAKRGTFAFDLSNPSKKGTLMKQGSLHRAFKYRYFVLYPGFLVYYDTETKWKVDLAKGETLGNRIGAIKLKSGSVSAARDAPKGCKFGLIVHAPDPVNKRQSYLLNALNKGDRDDWIGAIRKAIPSAKSPRNNKKEVKPEPKKESSLSRHPPIVTLRQDTAVKAALLASEEEEENEKETSIDSHLAVEPSINIRHNTADAAALLDSQEVAEGEEGLEEADEDTITSFDDEIFTKALGQKENGQEDSSDEEPVSPSSDIITNGHATPTSNEPTSNQDTPENNQAGKQCDKEANREPLGTNKSVGTVNGEPLNVERSVESSMDIEGTVEVVTSVRVQTSNGVGDEGEGGRGGEGEEEEEKKGGVRRSSAEVAIAEVKTALTVTLVRDNTVEVHDSDTESDDLSGGDTSSIPSSDYPIPDTPSTPLSPSTPSTPAIMVDKVSTIRKREKVESDTMTAEEEARALQTKEKRRRSSAPFMEKRGFLYKEGGQRKTWKLRYFVLQPGMFTYYKNHTSVKPLGEVKLKNLQVRYPGAGERKQSFQFTIHTESSWNKRNDYVIAAQSDAEMKEWVPAFKLAGQKNVSPSPSPPQPGSSEDEAS